MKKLLITTSFVFLSMNAPALADAERYDAVRALCDSGKVVCEKTDFIGKQALDSRVTVKEDYETPPSAEYRIPETEKPFHVHAEKQNCSHIADGAHQSDKPFRISVNGAPVQSAEALNSADVTRCQDLALHDADIQVRFDALQVEPALNVTANPSVAVADGEVIFSPYSNYGAFIEKAEVRIFAVGRSTQTEPLAIIPVERFDKGVVWTVPKNISTSSYVYLLRVYDKKGRFDETIPAQLAVRDLSRQLHEDEGKPRENLTGYGENNLGLRNIQVNGGTVTVNGSSLEVGSHVQVGDVQVPVDTNGVFAHREILPVGTYGFDIKTTNPEGVDAVYRRTVSIPKSDWFATGIADVTVGQNSVSGPASEVTGDDSNRNDGDFFAEGRLAFYTKGKLASGWEITASADTTEQPLEDLFDGFTDQDPRSVLRRIDPDETAFRTYGDDSTAVQDAPSQGRFFFSAEKNDTQFLWGDFQTRITGTDLVDFNRSLYGANAEHLSSNQTRFGEDRTVLNAFAADPGSVSARDEFQGTGGSLYFLQQQDIVIGSERIRIEERDRDSGVVVNVRNLVFGQDYDLNYIQGRVVLTDPLSSTSTQSTLVRSGSNTLSGNPQFVVINYEFAPTVADISNFTIGGRVSHWANDYVQLGFTAFNQNSSGASEQNLLGLDATLRYAPGTYLRLESARSDGAGNGETNSADGGFNFAEIDQLRDEGVDAFAHRAEIGIDFSDLTGGKRQGNVNLFTLFREDGYSAPGQLTNEETNQVGLSANIPFNGGRSSFNTKGDFISREDSGEIATLEVGGAHSFSDEHELSVALRYDERDIGAGVGGNSDNLSEEGQRTDLAARFHYSPLNAEGEKARYDVYGLGQVTLDSDSDRDSNNRIGVGGRFDVNDRLSLVGESTIGTGGLGSNIGLDYQANQRTNYYINYELDSERTDIGNRARNSSLTFGGRSRYTDSVSVFTEQRYETFDNEQSGLIHSFGLDVAATDKWTFGASFENGDIANADTGDIERTGFSLNSNYSSGKVFFGNALEARFEEFDNEPSRTTWLVRNNLSYQTTEDWRLTAQADFAISNTGGDISDTDFFELGLGYAYRPVDNDRLNLLFSYEYLQDETSPEQLAGTSSFSDFEQRSHVLSVDAIYDLVPKLSIGGSLGYRFGEIRDRTVEGSEFFDSEALLLIGRADYHVLKAWDIIGEVRHLVVTEADDSRTGALLGVYRHVNDNFRVGVGYNFTDFSDDLTDLDFDSNGVFLNFVGKF